VDRQLPVAILTYQPQNGRSTQIALASADNGSDLRHWIAKLPAASIEEHFTAKLRRHVDLANGLHIKPVEVQLAAHTDGKNDLAGMELVTIRVTNPNGFSGGCIQIMLDERDREAIGDMCLPYLFKEALLRVVRNSITREAIMLHDGFYAERMRSMRLEFTPLPTAASV